MKVKDDLTLSRLMTLSDVLTFEEQAKDEELLKSLLGKAMQEALARPECGPGGRGKAHRRRYSGARRIAHADCG